MKLVKGSPETTAAANATIVALSSAPIHRFPTLLVRVLLVWVFGSLLCAVGSAQCSTTSMAVIVNKSSHVDSLAVAQLRRLILGDIRNWPDQKPVAIVSREPTSSVNQCVLSKVVRLSDSEYHRYLMNAEFRGEEAIVTQTANSDAMAARIVAGSPGSFVVVDAASVPSFGGAVKVVRINGKLPGEAGYPL